MPMLALSRENIFVVICGILSGVIFSLTSYNADSGIIVLFLPLVPLAVVGLSLSARHGLVASLIACVLTGVMAGADYVLFFAVLIVLPLLHFVRKALLWRDEGQEKQWHPILPILAELTLMTCIVLTGFILILGHSEHADIKFIVAKALHKQLDPQLAQAHLTEQEPQFNAIMKKLTDEWNFMAFACLSWLWVLMVYAFIVVANIFLTARDIALRHSLAIVPGGLPLWMPFFIAAGVAVAAFGNNNDHYLGEVVVLIMVMPYFLSGVASFHLWSRPWPARWVWLILFYFILLLFPAFSAFVVAKGVLTQIEEVLKSYPAAKEH